MRTKATILSVCIALLIPATATATKPQPGTCKIAAPSMISTEQSFDVVVRPEVGQWFNPTVSVELVVPVNSTVNGPETYIQTVTQTFAGIGQPNVATATFIIPNRLSVDTSRRVDVFATVSEPVNRGKSIESECETFTSF